MTGGPAVPDVDWWDKSGPATLEHAAVLAHGTGRPPAPNRGPDGKPLYAVPDAFGPTSTMHDVHSLGELHGETGGMLPPPETLAIRVVEEHESTMALNTISRARGPGGEVMYELPLITDHQQAPPDRPSGSEAIYELPQQAPAPRTTHLYAAPRMPDTSPYAVPAPGSNPTAATAKAMYPVPADMVATGPMHNMRLLSELQNEPSVVPPPPDSLRFIAEQVTTLPMSPLDTLPAQGVPHRGVEVQYELPQPQSPGRPLRDKAHYVLPAPASGRAASKVLYPIPADQAVRRIRNMRSLSELDGGGADRVAPQPPAMLRRSWAEQESTSSIVGQIETLPGNGTQVAPPPAAFLPPKLILLPFGGGQPADAQPMPSSRAQEMFPIPAFRQTAQQVDRTKRDVRKRPAGARRSRSPGEAAPVSADTEC